MVEADVCVYGSMPSGVMAAVQAARPGKSVVLGRLSLRAADMQKTPVLPSFTTSLQAFHRGRLLKAWGNTMAVPLCSTSLSASFHQSYSGIRSRGIVGLATISCEIFSATVSRQIRSSTRCWTDPSAQLGPVLPMRP